MDSLSAREICEAVKGTFLCGNPEIYISQISTDTRKAAKNAVFFALVGDNFDANAYLDKAINQGASMIICNRCQKDLLNDDVTIVHVEDTLLALQQLATYYRQKLSKIKVVGVTGSNGKTSTKDFLNTVLSSCFSVHSTVGNFNNHIGLPLSVLAAESKDEIGVWEMGMNHPGEIAPLCDIAKPNMGIITNIGTAHIEYMKTREAIAKEKGELARALPNDGTLFIPADCDFVDYFKSITKAQVVTIGENKGDIRAEQVELHSQGTNFTLILKDQSKAKVSLPIVGKHMVLNALFAAGVAHKQGMTVNQIAATLSGASLTKGRLHVFNREGIIIIDDSYNANPESVHAALDTLAAMRLEEGGKRVAVLGKMAELGMHADQAYRAIGTQAQDLGVHIISVGEEANTISTTVQQYGGSAEHFTNKKEAAKYLKEYCQTGDAVLFKGSRSAAIEQVMHYAFPTDH